MPRRGGSLWHVHDASTTQAPCTTLCKERPIAAFLAKHDARLLELLNEGIRHLREAFSESRSFKIVLEADREVPGWEYLVVLVKTSLPAEEAHARLNAFADAWLLDHMAQVDGTLLFDLEYE